MPCTIGLRPTKSLHVDLTTDKTLKQPGVYVGICLPSATQWCPLFSIFHEKRCLATGYFSNIGRLFGNIGRLTEESTSANYIRPTQV